eukprot:5333491-Prymnesium_polylepis.1
MSVVLLLLLMLVPFTVKESVSMLVAISLRIEAVPLMTSVRCTRLSRKIVWCLPPRLSIYQDIGKKFRRMFLPKYTRNVKCRVVCKWCHARCDVKECFTLRDGPADHQFCNTVCSSKWVKYRHAIGVAHIVRMQPVHVMRIEYLKGKSIDQFITDGLVVKCERI